jgi:hypothetical protein
VRLKNRFGEERLESGYGDVLANVSLLDGSEAEIQIHIPEVYAANKIGHKLYEIERSLPEDDPRRLEMREMQRRLYAAAFEAAANSAISRANSSSSTGSPLKNAEALGNSLGLGSNAVARPSGSSATGMPSTSSNSEPSGSAGSSMSGNVANAQTLEQGATDAPAFKKWFGDSKVVDAEGKPLVIGGFYVKHDEQLLPIARRSTWTSLRG